ncbi:MAG: PEP/pyruvate-binding domain-containing protein [Saprospiraceae bacterium]|nr:PEP/pyruvate-binding domain-containing protein [Saprospiraceae bacterium]
MTNRNLFLTTIILTLFSMATAQVDHSIVKNLVATYKNDTRGPYKDIRWFCKDGSTREAKDPCPDSGGFQRARYKDEVVNLAQKHNIFLGQILKGNTHEEFYAVNKDHSKAKQYLLEKFLITNDDGWVLKKAQFYRGAFQAEDEEAWGSEFLNWLLEDSRFQNDKYYLNRELTKYLPHGAPNNTVEKIRALSKNVSDRVPSFMNLRIKIHGNPERTDVISVQEYLSNSKSKLGQQDSKELQELIQLMQAYYSISYIDKFKKAAQKLNSESILKEGLIELINSIKRSEDASHQVIRAADLLSIAKQKILEKRSAKSRLLHMDISLDLEAFVLAQLTEWKTKSISEKLSKSCYTGQVLNATGYTHDWEYEEVLGTYSQIEDRVMRFEDLLAYYKAVRRHINWGSGLIESEFGDEVRRFAGFEPLANGFIDDRIRSSALLPLGSQVSDLYAYLVESAGWENKIFESVSSSIQGINPGFAIGKLLIVEELGHEVDPKAIYLFRNPPSDLEPVAGILSISEGNMVSHLQLLARNLGIPNANVTEDLYRQFKQYEGKEIFYAVSNRGGVKIALAASMTNEEKQLFATRTIDEEVVTVPIDQMQLKDQKIYTLADLDAASSGIICGPKAANFARLKKMFPEQLVDGLVISFAIFKDHMLQVIPDRDITYWDHLNETFKEVSIKRERGEPDAEIEKYTLVRLTELSELIKKMPLKQDFLQELDKTFVSLFGKNIGQVPVFLRSDTNMEDLKDFTGAGLNLTVFNTIEREKVLQGIRDVWASPYSDRSYKWRQKYLTNPQDVYPSILVIPSVFVDYSGVIITKDFVDGIPCRINLALSQGVGGAVDGQKAEAWLMSRDGSDLLVSPARDPNYKRLTKNGGTERKKATLDKQMLTPQNKKDIWTIIQKIEQEMPLAGMQAPYDIELGFEGDKLWLFQIRPFVENKKASSSIYLSKLDPKIPTDQMINLEHEILF